MGCCGDENRVRSAAVNGRWVPPDLESFEGPIKNRQCRDVIFLIIFIVFCVFLIAALGVAGYRGDPYRLIYGHDGYGNVCGKKNEKIEGAESSGKDMTQKTYLVTIYEQGGLKWECASKCPEEYTEIGYRRCYKEIAKMSFGKQIGNYGQTFFDQLGSDLSLCYKEIIILCFISIALVCILIVVLRFCAAIVIWVVLIIVAVASIGVTAFLWYSWNQRKQKAENSSDGQPDKQNVQYWLAAAIMATIFTVIYLLIVFIMRKRIKLVAALFQEAGKAVGSMPLLLLQPFWTFLALVLVCAVMVAGYVYVHTSGTPTVDDQGRVTFPLDPFFKGFRWYHLFAFFWFTQFVVACQHIIVAGAIATWFFTRDKSRLNSPILVSLRNLIFYHLGSVAFGSFIIALVKLVRFIMKQAEKFLEKQQNAASCILKCCQCCLACFEKFLVYLNKNAYIEIAIYGYSFCKAAKEALSIITSNALRVAAINSVGDFVLFVGKIGVTAASALISIEVVKKKEGLYHDWSPVVIVCLFTFLVAHAFLSVYEMAIDTLFLCFCEDCSRNDGISKPYFMSKGLMRLVENSKKAIEVLDSQKRKRG